jgi:hypothetical protein
MMPALHTEKQSKRSRNFEIGKSTLEIWPLCFSPKFQISNFKLVSSFPNFLLSHSKFQAVNGHDNCLARQANGLEVTVFLSRKGCFWTDNNIKNPH